jgi:hypothetical protein
MFKHLIVWFFALLVVPLLVGFVVPGTVMLDIIKSDYAQIVDVAQDKETVDAAFKSYYEPNSEWAETHIVWLNQQHHDEDKYRATGHKAAGLIAELPAKWQTAVRYQVYGFSLKQVILAQFGVWLLIPTLLIIVSAVYWRKLKYETIGGYSPPIYNTASHVLIATVAINVLYMVCPLPVPITIVVLMSMVFNLSLGFAVANYPKW